MLQTEIWRGMHDAERAGAALWWRHRSVLLPQIPLVLAALALLLCALWAVGEYDRHRAEVRALETNRYLDEFRSGPVAGALAQLRAAWQATGARDKAPVVGPGSPRPGAPAKVRRNHYLFVLETIEAYHLQPEIHAVRQFVIRLATCIRVGSCDRNVAAAQLGPALWAFRDQHRPYFQSEQLQADLDSELATIAPRRALSSHP
jgi:hypothetical protein